MRECPGATAPEIAQRAAELIPGIQRNPSARAPLAILEKELPRFFHSPAACEMWRRQRQQIADEEAAANRRAEERRLEMENYWANLEEKSKGAG